MMRPIAVQFFVAGALLLGGAQARATNHTPLCEYAVTLLDAKARAAEVAVKCNRPLKGFRFADDFPADWVSGFSDMNKVDLRRNGSEWRAEQWANRRRALPTRSRRNGEVAR